MGLIDSVMGGKLEPTEIARVTPLVCQAALDGDVVANSLLDRAAEDLADMVCSCVQKLEMAATAFPLAIAGGLLTHCELLRQRLQVAIQKRGPRPDPLVVVEEPAQGSVALAQESLAAGS
jgi:N-acetylglucosamine kinase-like BadF-type ATPase